MSEAPSGRPGVTTWLCRCIEDTKLTCAVTSWSQGCSGSSCTDSGVRYLELLCVSIQLADTVRWSCENSATPSPRPLRTTSRSRVGFTMPSTTQTNLRPLPGPTGTVHMDVTNPSSDRDCQPVERFCSATSHVWCQNFVSSYSISKFLIFFEKGTVVLYQIYFL